MVKRLCVFIKTRVNEGGNLSVRQNIPHKKAWCILAFWCAAPFLCADYVMNFCLTLGETSKEIFSV